MADSQSILVFESDDEQAVELIANFLNEKGVNADVIEHKPDMPQGDAFGMTVTAYAGAESSGRFEVRIKDAEQFEQARILLTKHTEEILRRADLVQIQASEVVVECDDCSKSNVYSGALQGTVQECEHCGSYLDVPGGEDDYDWSIVDETISEDDEAAETDDEADAWG
ncbi:MAG TPA: hypothetical protein DD473_08615 [Planctomycetaceae bacterium]|nr:hypothetical protein [Planctomycetaceae bacterium]